ncbi:MAG: SDR family oxidoreductase [Blastocatellia bacterium]|nr:SDR family oxidoreductase [Blastocatellia bacterium]
MQTILIAGATGQLGRHVVREAKEHGFRTRILARNSAKAAELKPFADEIVHADLRFPIQLKSVCTGVDVVFSCAGASLDINNLRDRTTYTELDFQGNANLLDAAQNSGVPKFVFVSLFNAQKLLHTEYSAAHERFVEKLRAAKMPATVIRPTGFFYIFNEFLKMAQKNRGMLIGSGECRTNPIHEADLAQVCVQALEGNETEINVGGPEIFTRRQIVEMCFEVLGKQPKISVVSPAIVRSALPLVRLFHRRMANLVHFGMEVGLTEVVAPTYGKRTLRQYFEEAARKL